MCILTQNGVVSTKKIRNFWQILPDFKKQRQASQALLVQVVMSYHTDWPDSNLALLFKISLSWNNSFCYNDLEVSIAKY